MRRATVGLAALLTGDLTVSADEPSGNPGGAAYRSPYTVKFTTPKDDLLADFQAGARGDPKQESAVPFADWYSATVREKYGPWGPPAAVYPPPDKLADRSVAWKRERTIAVALRYQGYSYQHHHVPDWQPPDGWPWKEVASGRNGKGVDCSNFTSFVYNQGFGIKLLGDVHKQAEQHDLADAAGRPVHAQKVDIPKDYAEVVRTLRTGDLLYIRNEAGAISHVVLWVGPIGQSPDDVPLVLDSHGEGVKDSEGVLIPDGVQLRPFREKSWYFRSASHAHRIWLDP